MALAEWEMRQRQKGNVTGAEMARVLREQYGDVPLPTVQPGTRTEVRETSLQVVRFSDEGRANLEREGYIVYQLTGQSPAEMRQAQRPFWYVVDPGPQFLSLPSRRSEVAINIDPQKFFLPRSNNKTLDQQEAMIKEFSEKLGGKVAGIKAIMGEAPDYAELAFQHLDATRDRLFGERYDYRYARTKTPTVGSVVADVGSFNVRDGLGISDWSRGVGDDYVWASPLVVPTGK